MHFGQFNLMGYRTPGAKAHELYDNAVEQVKAHGLVLLTPHFASACGGQNG